MSAKITVDELLAIQKEHAAIIKALDECGEAAGNEHETYSPLQRIKSLVASRDYWMRKTEEERAKHEP